MEIDPAIQNARQRLLAELQPAGRWEGELSPSALATAVASFALKSAGRTELAERGLQWLREHRNADGGWGDSPESPSNFTTTLLCRCALDLETGDPEKLAAEILRFYGEDRTFSVPILTMCMLSGKLGSDWSVVPQLPFELAVFPHKVYRFLNLPVVSYALPALIAIGLVRHRHKPSPLAFHRNGLVGKVLGILRGIQPESGGFLEAAPLTGFVAMSLIGAGQGDHPVVQNAIGFLEETVRGDGSWPIDVNLSTWVTSLAVRALEGDLSEERQTAIRNHLVQTQWREEHPFTHAEPGGWGWTNHQGGVPDADDTAAALIALHQLGCETGVAEQGILWLLNLQNRDGGMPTFCRGWGKLPFDRSCPDLTAHMIRAFSLWRDAMDENLWAAMFDSILVGIEYLEKEQRPDGSWVPLWFGSQSHPEHENPVYGTCRVLEALAGLDEGEFPKAATMKARAFQWLETVRLDDLGLEELALVAGLTGKGVDELLEKTAQGTQFPASPIGLYFASLWYSEKLYPLIFALEALKRCKERDG
ncbi:Sporulenol synthase [Pontiella desulfatans]|uniref:Sporulenol synthase n=1 Tax=Pontiella desulfatans TaxID=2750659 RepID=A0A6C2UBT8_PONDE|nr:prenyltransferase/squalene oxidase repeat-containing protein [Pontiella desulfatans]VGO17515.1 Sporulenol synthase [Pontiella desulfatans]